MKIEFTTTPSSGDIDFLTQKITQETPGFGVAHPFAFFMKNDDGQTIAGCNGYVVYGAIYTDQLWVHPSLRKTGLGSSLMERVHEYARSIGCTFATLGTMSFQGAQKFYEGLGYQPILTVDGYTNKSHLTVFKKSL